MGTKMGVLEPVTLFICFISSSWLLFDYCLMLDLFSSIHEFDNSSLSEHIMVAEM